MDMEVIGRNILEFLKAHWLDAVAAIVIFVVGRWLAKVVSKLVGAAMTKAKIDATLTSFVENLCHIALVVLVIVAALDKLGVPTTNFAVVVGAAGLAIGFALQGSLSNFAAGVMLVIFKPFKVGDFVELGGQMGTVKEIQIFNTILNSPDNVRVIVPNSQVTGSNIMNYTVNGTRRIDLVMGVSYDDDLKKAQQIIERVLAEDSRILKDPPAEVAVSELGDSSVDFVVRPWVKATDYWDVRFDTTRKLKIALEEGGITIPYPQYEIHVKGKVS